MESSPADQVRFKIASKNINNPVFLEPAILISMSPKEVLEKIVEIFNTGNVSEVESIYSSDYIDHQKPEGMQIDGPGEFKQIVQGARKSLPNLKVTIEDVITQNEKVVARLQWHSVDNNGKKIERETIDILHFENGKAVEHWGAEA
jgi:predicted SnoaL-like aldol condensation-catalyzing enzyme